MTEEELEVFTHQLEVSISNKSACFVESATTIHGMATYEWKIRLLNDIMGANFGRPPIEQRDTPRLYVQSSAPFNTVRLPSIKKLIFTAAACDEIGRVLHGPVRTVVWPEMQRDGAVRVANDSEVIKLIEMAEKGNANQLDLSVTFYIPKSAFEIGNWPMAAPPPPEKRDFRFRPIDNPAQHNVRLICTDGVLPANRTALFQVSAYFRNLFKDNRGRSDFPEECSLFAMRIVITYILTECFVAPEFISPRLVDEIHRLMRRFSSPNPRALNEAIIQSACVQLVKEQDQLEQIIRWFLTAYEWEMPRLENVAMSLILTKYHNDFMLDYIVNQPVKPHQRELHERLHRRRNDFSINTPVRKILQARLNMVPHYSMKRI